MKDVTSLSRTVESTFRVDDSTPPLAYVLAIVIALIFAPFLWSMIKDLRQRRRRTRRNVRRYSDQIATHLKPRDDPPV